MDMERIRKSPLFAKLVADMPDMEDDLRVFNAKYREFIARDDKAVSTVLKCHLITEHFLNAYLAACNPAINDWENARLTFAQKLALADHPRSSVRLLIPGLACLNKLRNRLVHNLDCEFEESQVSPIREFMTIWSKAGGKVLPVGIAFVQQFTLLASGWLHGYACSIMLHASGKGLPGILEWYADDSKSQTS